MVSRHYRQQFDDGCGGSTVDDSNGNHADSPHRLRGKEIMNSGTKRTVIAAAALAAAGLFGSLPFDGSSVAQQGVPTVHRDVALVDDFTPLLTDEGTFDTALFNDVLGTGGAEDQLFTALSGTLGATPATTLLDATGANPIFSGDFDGAESRAFEALFLDGLATEDQVNQALGATPLESQTELLSVFNSDFVPIPSSADLTAADLASAVGTSTFDDGLVVDTRVYTPLSDIAPAQEGDSGASGMQHMAVVRDFLIP